MAFEELKERIKEAPISQVISHYIPLNKKGSTLQALCPFHADTKPSMVVTDNKGMYKCFACGAGGDAITFVKNFKNLEFVDTLREIAGILGLPFEEQKEKRKNPRVEMALRVLSASTRLYKMVASQNPPLYTEFMAKRRLSPESIATFEIGFAPGNNALFNYLDTLPGADGDFARTTAKDIGIIRYNSERDSHYDFFRTRVMFPIHDHSGHIRGYSARAVLPDEKAKYINSNESFIFDKGSILFGYYFGKNAIRQNDRALLVEGNIDVITMHQFGFQECVGTMGTALSEHSVRLLGNMTKNIYLGLDNDQAGKLAMHRINAEFMNHGILPKYLTFEPHKDPDEFLMHEGRLALLERIEKAPIYLDVLIQELFADKIPDAIDQKIELMRKIEELVSPLKESLSATERVVNAAKVLGMKSDASAILENYKDFLSRQKEKVRPVVEKPKLEESEELLSLQEEEARNLQVSIASQVLPPPTKSEGVFIREILCHPEFLTHLNIDEFLATIRHDEVQKLIRWLVKIYLEIDDSEYVSIVMEELQYGGYSKEIIDIGTAALFNYGNKLNEKVIHKMLKDYHLMLRMDQLKIRRKELVAKQKSSPTQVEVDLILSEIAKLDKEIMHLKDTDP